MTVAIQINNIDEGSQSLYVTGFLIVSGNYPTGGDPLDFTQATADPTFVGMVAQIISSGLLNLDVWSMNGSSIAGGNSTAYSTVCTKTGTPPIINTKTGAKLKCAALNASPTTEHSASAYESQYTGDIIAFMAEFTKLI